jgi:DNA modification methylase
MMIVNGDAFEVLKTLPDNSVHCAITSPPYFGLRAYKTPPVLWDADPNCEHDWGTVHPPGFRESDTKPGAMQSDGTKNRENLTSQFCSKCGAWKGELGLEPTPELYVKHLVEIFRELRRVLRDDGTFWLNIGDSYASGGRKTRDPGKSKMHPSFEDDGYPDGIRPDDPPGVKPKDLIGIPWMLAFALRSDGWYLRADLPWIKRNSMPSSVRDRPASSIEHVFLLAKSKKYYYDHIATMQPSSESYNKDKRPRGVIRQCVNENSKYPDEGQFKKQDNAGNNTYTGFNARYAEAKKEFEGKALGCDANSSNRRMALNTKAAREASGEHDGCFGALRFMRDSDFFFRTWQGLLHNEDGEPMALIVNPRGYKEAHFATFPVQLVEPMILASTSEKGICSRCGAPWKRLTKKETIHHEKWFGDKQDARNSRGSAGNSYDEPIGYDTIGWEPTCKCNVVGVLQSGVVLDPFSGSSATGVACKWHNRNYIGIELNPEYCGMGERRIENDGDKNGSKIKSKRQPKKETVEASTERKDTDRADVGSPTRIFYDDPKREIVESPAPETRQPQGEPGVVRYDTSIPESGRLQGVPEDVLVRPILREMHRTDNGEQVQPVRAKDDVSLDREQPVGIMPNVQRKTMKEEYDKSYDETTAHAKITCKCGTAVWYGCGVKQLTRPKYCAACEKIERRRITESYKDKVDSHELHRILEWELRRGINR